MPSSKTGKTPENEESWTYPASFSTTIPSSKICSRHRHTIAITIIIGILSFSVLVVLLSALLDGGKNPTNMSLEIDEKIEPVVQDPPVLGENDDTIDSTSVTNENDDTLDSKASKWHHTEPVFSGAGVNSQFGFSVSLAHDPDFIAIGSPNYLRGRGMVTVYNMDKDEKYRWENDTTTFVGEKERMEIGTSVALSGNGLWLAYSGPGQVRNGFIKILKRNDNNEWEEEVEFIGELSGAEIGFTLKFSKSGDKLVAGTALGEVILYERPGGAETWRIADAVFRYFDNANQEFTIADISGDGNRIIVACDAGDSVKIFDWDGMEWGETADLISTETGFGNVLAIAKHGKRIAIGSDNGNYVRVVDYHASSYKWLTVGDVIYGDESDDSKFGAALALSADGKMLAIGSPKRDIGSNHQTGTVSVYALNNNKVWENKGDVIEGSSDDGMFGYAVSMSQHGRYVAVGGPRNMNSTMFNVGTVNIYEFGS